MVWLAGRGTQLLRSKSGELERIGSLDGPDDRKRSRLERAVLDLLEGDYASPAVEQFTVRAA